MMDWEITSTTFRCDDVKEDVTLLVLKDMSVKCSGHGQYEKNKKCLTERFLRSKSEKQRERTCKGLNCPMVIAYKDRILWEETYHKRKI